MAKIFINIEASCAEEARAEMGKFLGATAMHLTYGGAPHSAESGALTAGSRVPEDNPEAVDAGPQGASAVEPEKPKRTRRTKAEIEAERAAAAAGNEPAPDPETEAQDADDEAADEANQRAELTHDDVRNALMGYVTKFGMPAATEDGQKVFALLFGDKVTKTSEVPGDQDSLRRAIDGVNEMLAKNPYERKAV